MKTIQLVLLLLMTIINANAQYIKSHQIKPQILNKIEPTIEWAKCFGGNYYDQAATIINTKDGGFLILGFVQSKNYEIDGKYGGCDFLVIKINSKGEKEWNKCLGGSNWEEPFSIIQTKDGGYAAVGSTSSNDGFVSGNHGGSDCWIVKIDSFGIFEWQKCLGGSRDDEAHFVQQTSDGGYIITGSTGSIDGDVSGKHSDLDYKITDYTYFKDSWVVKLDKSGKIEWQKCLGGNRHDSGRTILQTLDGGYIVANGTMSYDGDVIGFYGKTNCWHDCTSDYWIVKLDSLGSIIWQKCFGGDDNDSPASLIITKDGGYIVTGISNSRDGDLVGIRTNNSYPDFWTIKLSIKGEIEWQICNGAFYNDGARSIIQVNDGYVILGYASSFYGISNKSHGFEDFGIVKLSLTGKVIWQKMVGSSGSDWPEAIVQSEDGGFAAVGYVAENDGDVTGMHGERDIWVLKLSPEGENGILEAESEQNKMNIFPNPAMDHIILGFQNNELQQKIEIFNVFGVCILSTLSLRDYPIDRNLRIDVSSLIPGVYIVKIGDEKPQKFIKV
jgi:hypothetical protein